MVVSFGSPEYTVGVDAIGILQMPEVIRFLGLQKNWILSAYIPLFAVHQMETSG
jgi:GDP-D-mannose dehydratase